MRRIIGRRQKKNIEREYARNKHQNVSAKDKRKLNERKKKNICSISWEVLQQWIEQVIKHRRTHEKIEKLKRQAHYKRNYFWNQIKRGADKNIQEKKVALLFLS